MWEEYTRGICMSQGVDVLWMRDIETEKLRATALSLIVGYEMEGIFKEADQPMPERTGGAIREAPRIHCVIRRGVNAILCVSCSSGDD